MTHRIYVAELSLETNDDTLYRYFSQFGMVEEAIVVKDPGTGLSRRFAYVDFSTEKEAIDAINKADGVEFEGSTIRVTEYEKRPPSGGGGWASGGWSSGGSRKTP